MIIQIAEDKSTRPIKKMSWQAKFKLQLIRRNNEALRKEPEINPILMRKRKAADDKFERLFTKTQKQRPQIHEDSSPQQHHSYYSSYVPLQRHFPVADEYLENFPYLRYLDENSRTAEKAQFYTEITTDLKEGKDKGKAEEAWQNCFKKFLPQIGLLQAIQCYEELLKYGSKALDAIYIKKGCKCKKQIFFHRICQVQKYFKEDSKIRKEIGVSVESVQEINVTNLGKTSKTLFCSICLLYDCGLHKMDDKIFENTQYVSPQNIWPESEKIIRAAQILQFYALFIAGEGESSSKEAYLSNQNAAICSQHCYKLLTKDKYSKLQFQRVKFLSAVVKSYIHMGIQIFCYDPCNIWHLFPPQSHRGLTCSLVFLYLIENYDLPRRIERKFFDSEFQMLENEKAFDTCLINRTVPTHLKRKLNQDLQNRTRRAREKTTQIATCFHYFIGQEPTDLGCSECSCHERGFCLPQCLCGPDCPIMKVGCNCRSDKDECRTHKCPCFISKFECQPITCPNCFDCPSKNVKKRNQCYNDQIMRGGRKLIRVGPSTIPGAGLGGFAGEFIETDSLVSVYSGQIIPHQIELMRQFMSRDLSFYNFGSPYGTIDARYMGNRSRFVNHANDGKDNLRANYMFTGGSEIVSFYAERDIEKGEELFFNYDGNGDLQKNFKDKYPFITKKKK